MGARVYSLFQHSAHIDFITVKTRVAPFPRRLDVRHVWRAYGVDCTNLYAALQVKMPSYAARCRLINAREDRFKFLGRDTFKNDYLHDEAKDWSYIDGCVCNRCMPEWGILRNESPLRFASV